MSFDFVPNVTGISSQPFRIAWTTPLPQYSHVLDVFIRHADGTAVVIDVRPDARVKPVDEEVFQAAIRPCAREPSLTQLADILASAGPQTISYHYEFVLAETLTVRKIANQGKLLVTLNHHEISGCRGLIVSGPWASGKTTAIKLLGNTHELLVRRKFPDQCDRIRVVYITTPPTSSPKKLAGEFANFLGNPTGLGRMSPI